MRRNEKGITLVALVVTIIVLLILAGVSLSLVAGGNGILTRASGAAEKNTIASAGEQAELLIAEAQTAYYSAKYAGETTSYATTDMITFVKAYINDNAHKTADGYKVEINDGNTQISVKNGSTIVAKHAITYDSANDKITVTAGAKWVAGS